MHTVIPCIDSRFHTMMNTNATPLLRWFLNYDRVATVNNNIANLNLGRTTHIDIDNSDELDESFHKLYNSQRQYKTFEKDFTKRFGNVTLRGNTNNDRIDEMVRYIEERTNSFQDFLQFTEDVFRMIGAFYVLFGRNVQTQESVYSERHFERLGKTKLRRLYKICACYYVNFIDSNYGGIFDSAFMAKLMISIRLRITQMVHFSSFERRHQTVLTYFIRWLEQYCSLERANAMKLSRDTNTYQNLVVSLLPREIQSIIHDSVFANGTGENFETKLRIYKESMYRIMRDNISIPDEHVHAQTIEGLNYDVDTSSWFKSALNNDYISILRRFLEISEVGFTSRGSNEPVDTYTGLCQKIHRDTMYHQQETFEDILLDVIAIETKSNDVIDRQTIERCIRVISKGDGGVKQLAIEPMCHVEFDRSISNIPLKRLLYSKAVCMLIQTVLIRSLSMHACNEGFLSRGLSATIEIFTHFRIIHAAGSALKYVKNKLEEEVPNHSSSIQRLQTEMDNFMTTRNTNVTFPMTNPTTNVTEDVSFQTFDILVMSMMRLQNAIDALNADPIRDTAAERVHPDVPVVTKGECVFRQKSFEAAILFNIAMRGIHQDVVRVFNTCEELLLMYCVELGIRIGTIQYLQTARKNFTENRTEQNYDILRFEILSLTNICIHELDSKLAPLYAQVYRQRRGRNVNMDRWEEYKNSKLI
jgi:hypothetical protein